MPGPVRDSVTAPDTIPETGRPPAKMTSTSSVPDPEPEVGLTLSQGWLVLAVQVAAPPTACVSRTVCFDVFDVNAVAVLAAPNRKRSGLTDTTGGGSPA